MTSTGDLTRIDERFTLIFFEKDDYLFKKERKNNENAFDVFLWRTFRTLFVYYPRLGPLVCYLNCTFIF